MLIVLPFAPQVFLIKGVEKERKRERERGRGRGKEREREGCFCKRFFFLFWLLFGARITSGKVSCNSEPRKQTY